MSADSKRLSRYVDGDMTPVEAAAFEARLRASHRLQQELAALKQVGQELRHWSRDVEARASDLMEPTLLRAAESHRRRAWHAKARHAAVALALLALPWARLDPGLAPRGVAALLPASAAIVRVEAADRRAQVFVVGSGSTPVLWLADDTPEEGAGEPEPG